MTGATFRDRWRSWNGSTTTTIAPDNMPLPSYTTPVTATNNASGSEFEEQDSESRRRGATEQVAIRCLFGVLCSMGSWAILAGILAACTRSRGGMEGIKAIVYFLIITSPVLWLIIVLTAALNSLNVSCLRVALVWIMHVTIWIVLIVVGARVQLAAKMF